MRAAPPNHRQTGPTIPRPHLLHQAYLPCLVGRIGLRKQDSPQVRLLRKGLPRGVTFKKCNVYPVRSNLFREEFENPQHFREKFGVNGITWTRGNDIFVVFAGSDDFYDWLADAKIGIWDLAADSVSQNNPKVQVDIARKVVSRYLDDSRRVFVIGHSLGGYLVQRVAEELDIHKGYSLSSPGIVLDFDSTYATKIVGCRVNPKRA